MYKGKLSTTVFIIILLFTFQNNFSQETCKVLTDNLVGTYEGKCKKGLAHGKGKAVGTDSYEGVFSKGFPSGNGTYTWANGDIYIGKWKKGKRQGEGVLKYKINGKDTIMAGLWEDNRYLGPKPIPPKVTEARSIDRYTIKKYGNEINRVLISFQQNGVRNPHITNLLLTTSCGIETSLGYMIGFRDFEFPIKIKLSYKTKNKLLTSEYNVSFEFEIFERGDWRVEINN